MSSRAARPRRTLEIVSWALVAQVKGGAESQMHADKPGVHEKRENESQRQKGSDEPEERTRLKSQRMDGESRRTEQ